MLNLVSIVTVRYQELGLRFRRNQLTEVLKPGWYVAFDLLGERIEVISEKDLLLENEELEQILRTGLLDDAVEGVRLTDTERALLWVDGRFERVLTPGVYAIFKRLRQVKVEKLSLEDPLFENSRAFTVARAAGSEVALTSVQVEQGQVGLYFRDGRLVRELAPGFYAFWKNIATVKIVPVDLREKQLDLSGQEIITADKVTLRLNAVLTYQVTDARLSVQVAENAEQALYREGQLVLREAVGSRTLDGILNEKDALAQSITAALKQKANRFGLAIVSFGIRDIILPGDMRELMNRVVAAQKEAEANQIVRREETAATRSQCNTAKMMEQNPVLMRLRELEVLERIAEKSQLKLVLGEKGLTERVMNML
ncbi:MAG TPA: slipin family protein [Candidatus Ozemobacteraceae bacterium]|nr:slipin family protein [Candidatus Ozemobacteraceae bacterium]